MTKYNIWLPFELPPGRGFKDMSSEFAVGDYRASIKEHQHLHVLNLQEIELEETASALIPRLCIALRWAALSVGIGLQATDSVDEVTWKNRGNDTDIPGGGATDKGIFRGNMICIYPDDANVTTITGGRAGVHQKYPVTSFGGAVNEGIQKIDFDRLGGKLRLALELYCLTDFEISAQAKFLSLCMALEVAAPHPRVSQEVADQIDGWIEESKTSDNPEVQKLVGALGRFKTVGHREAVRSFVEFALSRDGHTRAQEVAKEARDFYDDRGNLVHEGKLDVGEKISKLRKIVSETLQAALVHGLVKD